MSFKSSLQVLIVLHLQLNVVLFTNQFNNREIETTTNKQLATWNFKILNVDFASLLDSMMTIHRELSEKEKLVEFIWDEMLEVDCVFKFSQEFFSN